MVQMDIPYRSAYNVPGMNHKSERRIMNPWQKGLMTGSLKDSPAA